MSKELTIEEQIAKLEKETQKKIKELRSNLSWEKRFKSVMDNYVASNREVIANNMTGYDCTTSMQITINAVLMEVGLKVKYNSSTFNNDLYNQINITDYMDTENLSEYPVYTVFEVTDSKGEHCGYVRFESLYSSYNGNEFCGYNFVKPKEVVCTVFDKYKV